jgi:hypothetical protein
MIRQIEGREKHGMTRARLDGLYLLLLGSLVFVSVGFFMEYTDSNAMGDFKGVYCSVRSLLQHRDPYKADEVLRSYEEEAGNRSLSPDELRHALTLTIYLPSMFIFIAPFAMLPWGTAHLLWMIFYRREFYLRLVYDVGCRSKQSASVLRRASCILCRQ